MRIVYTVISSLLVVGLLSGCSLEQKQIMGANANENEGFSGYGTERVRYMEGPLTDMMVIDETPKGRTKYSEDIARKNINISGERNLSMPNQGTNRVGSRVLTNSPGLLHDKRMMSDKPHMEKSGITIQQENDLESVIQSRLLAFNNVHEVHVITIDNKTLVGVKSSEQNRKKLELELRNDLSKIMSLENIYIATDRLNANRIKALKKGFSTAEPFEGIGAAWSEIIDNLDGTTR
ncbi:YhcN/YlaJ family sporulation lipoprotein [Bacillus sp. FJAT-45350]|uniref:YhcN/YlaJ family sporulation lipoprotein n=1 Tax=Bacillus sp. FJAT-45350 TaxID=2011014 RepID=UPI000BB81566|nr:YhcN/YlaJ family sporulation lipoprotein [Bacillus sp. FJAT-45350]